MNKKLKKNSFMHGTIIASLSIIFVKILGALYVIPFYKIIGEQGGALYSYAYTIYNLFLNISTAGIPIALSMIVSEFCTKNMYEAKERAYNISKSFVVLLSLISFAIIFIFADKIVGLAA
jgi:O-antigen/teichoic acid export membrane protein